MYRIIHSLISVLLLSAAAVSCHPEKEPVQPKDTRLLNLPEPEIYLTSEAGGFDVPVEANFDYKITIDAAWVTVDGGTADKPHFLSDANPYGSDRSCKIRFTDVSDRYYYKEVTVIQAAPDVVLTSISIVDKQATAETKALLANLWLIADTGWMFGHHDDLWYGRYWYNEPGGSDTKAVCGDYPAVFSVDFAEIMHKGADTQENQIRRRVILEARERGEVIIACAHLDNPKTGGDAWIDDEKEAAKGTVKEILTDGSAAQKKFQGWLDNLADFMSNLKDSHGNLIPVILRIYHEHTQSWSWWGSSCTTDSEFMDLWRFTVTYLRDTKGVHNFLYAISPQMDGQYASPKDRIRSRWPGDEWVDFIGMDCYHGSNNNAFKSNLKALESVSKEKRKPCGVTEDGIESFTQKDYWTRYVVTPTEGCRISMVTMWRNKYVGSNEADKHYYSVYPGHPSEDDFRAMYALDRSLFSADLPEMYMLPAGFEVK